MFSSKTHQNLLFFSFLLLAIGMPSSKALMSFGLVFSILNWFLEGGFKQKIALIKSNRLLQLVIAFYILLIVGVCWSWEPLQGLKDLKSRLPMIAIPLILSTSINQLSSNQIFNLLKLFIAALAITSIYNVLYYNSFIRSDVSKDIRSMSRFASHIRYGLLIAFGFAMCVWLQLKNRKFNFVLAILMLWFSFYSFYSQILSGIFSYFLVCFILLFYLLYTWRKFLAYIVFVAVFIFIAWCLFFVTNIHHEQIDCSKLPKYTAQGNIYNHNCNTFSEINGKAILANYSVIELFEEWNKVSQVNFMGLDKKGHHLRMTAARYLTSLNLSKDSIGFSQLNEQDIQNIIDGYTYRMERNQLILPRLYGLKYQLINPHYPNGHSLLQRFEHWKTALFIIRNHWIIGVGTGGNQLAFDNAYVETNSPLNPENRLKSHNMFLSYFVSYGVLGGLFFMLLITYLWKSAWNKRDLLMLCFLAICCGSFLIEDTLETQLGVTFFGFFIAIHLVLRNQEDDTVSNEKV